MDEPNRHLEREIQDYEDDEIWEMTRMVLLVEALIEDRKFREFTLLKLLKDMSFAAVKYRLSGNELGADLLEQWVKTTMITFQLFGKWE